MINKWLDKGGYVWIVYGVLHFSLSILTLMGACDLNLQLVNLFTTTYPCLGNNDSSSGGFPEDANVGTYRIELV
jgi:hypothetical protein